MNDQLGSWVIFGAVALFCLTVAVRGLMGAHGISEDDEAAS